MSEKNKCYIKKNPEVGYMVMVCEGLWSLLNHSDFKSGMRRANFTNIKTGEASYSAIVVYSGEHKKNGLLLNHCPICGANIETWRHYENETKVKP